MPTIEVSAWMAPPDDEAIRALTGSVLSAPIQVEFGAEPVPLLELFRFARVIAVDSVPAARTDAPPCPRCEDPARHRIVVEWEAGYTSPDGNVLCENCVHGVVTASAEVIRFRADDPSPVAYEVSIRYTLRPTKGPE
jgi:hypothetical protein